ncbi:MAG TPA: aminodeoxychorismate/anthranilate synthase component II [Thermomicrobiales bacterium]|jgi:anthranilate synthase component 2|nr:aminodeoxychorismate/anthranilate synthase component II [Thermomicrobiales bacterium]
MIFLLDNYDSFTFNLYQYLRELGAEVEVVRNDQTTVDEVAARVASGEIEKVVLSPGPCTPAEAGISVPLVRELAGKVPILGVCLGHQAIGAAFGGDVVRAPSLMHGKTSLVHHEGQGVFHDLPTPFEAIRYHSLVVDRETLPDELEVTAETEDGLVMGFRHRELDIEGVQFHPESIMTLPGKDLLANFLAGGDRRELATAGASDDRVPLGY